MPLLGHLHLLDPFRQRRVEHRRVVGGDEAAEFGNQRGRADRLGTARLDRVDVDAEHVALFRSPTAIGPALRVEERHVEQFGRAVVLGLDRSLERVLGLRNDDIAGIDAQHGVRVRAVDVVIFALLGLRQLVSLAGLPFATPCARHVGST